MWPGRDTGSGSGSQPPEGPVAARTGPSNMPLGRSDAALMLPKRGAGTHPGRVAGPRGGSSATAGGPPRAR